MRCTGCFKELDTGLKAYATVVGSIEPIGNCGEELGFYPEETERWITVMSEDCGMAAHRYIAQELHAGNQ